MRNDLKLRITWWLGRIPGSTRDGSDGCGLALVVPLCLFPFISTQSNTKKGAEQRRYATGLHNPVRHFVMVPKVELWKPAFRYPSIGGLDWSPWVRVEGRWDTP